MTDYGASDTSTTTLGANQFPISEAWVPNAALTAVEGIAQNTDAGGKKSTALRMGMKDGDDATQGTSTDANTVNSVMGRLTKIRDLLNATLTVGGTITEANSAAISTALGAISDAAWSGSGNGSEIAILKKIVAELTAGQATMANSLPVTMASNQTAMPIGSAAGTAYGADQTNTRQQISLYGTQTTAGDTAVGVDSNNRVKIAPAPANAGVIIGQVKLVDTAGTNQAGVDASNNQLVKVNTALPAGTNLIGYIGRSTVAAYSLASTTTSGSTQNSGDIAVGPYAEISIDINTTAQAGTSPTIQYFYERKAADGIYYVLWQSAVLTAAANTISTSIGAGMAYNQSLGVTGRLRWVVGGSATPTFTHSLNIQGK